VGAIFTFWIHVAQARLMWLRGQWDDALVEVAAAREAPDNLGFGPHLDGIAARIAIHRGDGALLAACRGGLQQPLTSGNAVRALNDQVWAAGLDLVASGRPADALTAWEVAWHESVAGAHQYTSHYFLPAAVATAMDLGEIGRARALAAGLEAYASGRGSPSMARSALFCTGLAHGDVDRLLETAVASAAVGVPLAEGKAREHAAHWLEEAGKAREAREQLERAADIFNALGASWDVSRISSKLRLRGVRRGVSGPRRRPRSGWAALTDTELRVASLVAEGLSNPEIGSRMYLSRRTVQTHVSSILAKLGVTSRVELATEVIRHGSQAGQLAWSRSGRPS
jgi:DNA-binding NarL/FixJ family response regulator